MLTVESQVPAINKLDSVTHVPATYLTRIEKKYSTIDQKLTKQTENYLRGLEKLEQKIQGKLNRLQGKAMQSLTKRKYEFKAVTISVTMRQNKKLFKIK